MSDNTSNGGGQTIVIHDKRVGSGAGIGSIIFGILGIFFLGIVFVPLSLIFGIVAVAKKQYALGIIGLICCAIAAITSPTLWAIFGISALISVS